MKNIEELLTRFMDGATSEQEEQQLADFFRTKKDIPAEWQEYADMFRAFDIGEPGFCAEELEACVQMPKRRLWPWVATAACVAAVVFGLQYIHTPVDTVQITPLPQAELAKLLAPTADDTLRWVMDKEIEGELALGGCKADDFICSFNSHSQLIEDNHNPQYVNNVLGRLLMLCREKGQQHTDAFVRRACIDTLEMLSAELGADKQNANNLGIGLCQQCIRALGGTPKQYQQT